MHTFEYILILLVAVLASSFIGARFPKLPTPLVQIASGVALSLFPINFEIHLDPELFMVVFIAPLLFDDAKRMDKPSLWRFKYPVLLLALGLVFCTVLVLGYTVNLFAPSIPLAAAFALAAALAPTDAVAVSSIKKNAKISDEQSRVLQGESLLNDASSIVSFNFAIAAAITGTFSLLAAEGSFIVKFFGGLGLGVGLMLIRYALLYFLRARGIDSISFHVLFEIITPLLVYLLAEIIGVSGIIAVVAAGITHSFSPPVITPTSARLTVVSTSVWSVISFTLNGLVFLILGSQLPYVTARVWTGTAADTNYLLLFLFFILFVSLLLRFIWVLIMRRNANLAVVSKNTVSVTETPASHNDAANIQDEEDSGDKTEAASVVEVNTVAVAPDIVAQDAFAPGYEDMSRDERKAVVTEMASAEKEQKRAIRDKRKEERRKARAENKKIAHADEKYWKHHLYDSLILTLAGVKGAISLAIVLSVPLTLGGTQLFPERDLLIFLASGVILLSLLVGNIALPLIAPKKKTSSYELEELNAILDIYRKVITSLDEAASPSERAVTGLVVQQYYLRMNTLKENNSLELPHESQVRRYVIELQLENSQRLIDEGKVGNFSALFYINSLSHQLARIEHHSTLRWELKAFWTQFRHWLAMSKRVIIKNEEGSSKGLGLQRYEMQALQLENSQYVLKKLRELEPSEEMPAHTVAVIKTELEQRVLRMNGQRGENLSQSNRQKRERSRIVVVARALDLEREAIREAHEENLISTEIAKRMRDNVAIMELDVEDQLG